MAGARIEPWGRSNAGDIVRLITLRNARGFEARLSDYGAMIVGLKTPDRDGRLDDVVLGFADFSDYGSGAYRAAGPYFGATVGRYANRIAGARFVLDGRAYELARNEGDNQLHGGPRGFSQAVWRLDEAAIEHGVRFSLESPDGDQGFPGMLRVQVEMSLGEDEDVLILRYRATTDRSTHVNLTNHAYFNLDPRRAGDIRGHRLQVFADHFTPTAADFLPTGVIAEVAGSPLDLRSPTLLGEAIAHPGLAASRGFNHNYVLAGRGALTLAARLSEGRTGRAMEVWTTEPGLQVYSAGYLADLAGSNGEMFGRDAGVCLETQHFPDTPNQPAFPSTLLSPGEIFESETRFTFSTF